MVAVAVAVYISSKRVWIGIGRSRRDFTLKCRCMTFRNRRVVHLNRFCFLLLDLQNSSSESNRIDDV